MNKNSAAPFAPDSTQTIRALTRAELENLTQPKWYVVQLVTSDQPINLDMMPRLEVFTAYSLYTVVGRQDGHRHALRLGFFSEESSAQMICGYLQTFFAAPTIVRVSGAEQERFGSAAKKPKTPESATAKVVQLAATRDPRTATTTVDVKTKQRAAPPVTRQIASHAGTARPMTSNAVAPTSCEADKRTSQPKGSVGGPARNGIKKSKTLGEELMEEARQVALSKSGKHRIPQREQSWLSRLLGRSKG